MRHEAHTAQLLAQKDNTRNELERYAQVTCYQLCAKMLEACPREIRDYIYAYLLPDSPVILQHCDHHDYCGCEFCAQGSDILEKFAQPPCHLRNAAYVTSEFSSELLEAFYRTNTFDLGHHFASLGAFRTMKAGNLGIIPVNYILNLSMLVQCEEYDFEGAVAFRDTYDDYPVKSRRTLLGDLEALFGFKSGTKITLHLDVKRGGLSGDQGAEHWEHDTVVPVILPTMRRLAAAGTKVKLRFDYSWCEVVIDNEDVTLEDIKEQYEKVRRYWGDAV